jgi:hypothetical protein
VSRADAARKCHHNIGLPFAQHLLAAPRSRAPAVHLPLHRILHPRDAIRLRPVFAETVRAACPARDDRFDADLAMDRPECCLNERRVTKPNFFGGSNLTYW